MPLLLYNNAVFHILAYSISECIYNNYYIYIFLANIKISDIILINSLYYNTCVTFLLLQ